MLSIVIVTTWAGVRCHLVNSSVTVDKPKTCDYPTVLNSIGDHIRKRRLDLKLFQKDVAKQIGTATQTITNWEVNQTEPRINFIPKIINFLGYNFLPKPKTYVEMLTHYRLSQGLSIDRFSEILQIDPGTIWDWEQGNHQPTKKLKKRIELQIKIKSE